MANFNHAAYLRQSIEAMVHQAPTPDEFVILDDCSTDNSVEIIESYRARHPFLRLIRRETNGGAAAAYDELLNAARCDYVYTAAADDYVLPGFFDRAMAAARQNPQAGIIFGKMIAVNAAGQKLRDVQSPQWTTTRYLSPSEYLDYLDSQPPYRSLSGATVYRRECLQEVGGFPRDLGHWCDTFAIRAIALKYGAVYVPETFMAWRKLPDSLSHGTQRRLRQNLGIVARAAELMRTPKFRERFPERHVKRWLRGYRAAIALNYLRALATHPSPFGRRWPKAG